MGDEENCTESFGNLRQGINYYPPDGGILGRQNGKGFWMK
jgi:hypothetical protein